MRSPNKHLPAEERRAVTVETVIALAGEQNPRDITTAAIAGRMGLTQGALFRHFPTKEAVLQAVMAWVAERLLSRIDRAAATTPATRDALEAVFLTHVDFISRHPGVPRMLLGELQDPQDSLPKQMVETMLGKYRQRLHGLLAAGKDRGELPPSLDLDAAITQFIGTIQGLVMQSLLANDVGRMRRDAPAVFAIYLRGIEAET